MGTIGYGELLLIFLIVLLLFGGRKIPEIAKGLGKGMREFKKARDDIHDAIEREIDDIERPPAPQTTPPKQAEQPPAEAKPTETA